MITQDSCILYANNSLTEMMGYSVQEVLGTKVWIICTPRRKRKCYSAIGIG